MRRSPNTWDSKRRERLMAAATGFEPALPGLLSWRPEPLDDAAVRSQKETRLTHLKVSLRVSYFPRTIRIRTAPSRYDQLTDSPRPGSADGVERVAHRAHGAQQIGAAGAVECLAQPPDMHID